MVPGPTRVEYRISQSEEYDETSTIDGATKRVMDVSKWKHVPHAAPATGVSGGAPYGATSGPCLWGIRARGAADQK